MVGSLVSAGANAISWREVQANPVTKKCRAMLPARRTALCPQDRGRGRDGEEML